MVINTDPSSQQHTIVVVCIVSPILSSLSVAIRVWTKGFITPSIGWDDYAALITLPFCIAYSVLVGIGTNYGFGWHIADMPPDGSIAYNKWIYVSSMAYLVCLLGYKFTILLLYLRLFGVDQIFRYITWAVMFFVFGYLFSNFLVQIFGCTPIEKYWKPTIRGHCIVLLWSVYAYGSMNFISDLFIFVLPLPMVWRLHLSQKAKIGVTFVFMGGAIAFVVAVVRFGILIHRFHVTDTTWYDGKNLIWMVLEVNTGLICSCTLAFKPFFRYVASPSFPKIPSGGFISQPKNSAPSRERNDSRPLARRGTGGFVILGNEEMEMEARHNKPSEMVQDV